MTDARAWRPLDLETLRILFPHRSRRFVAAALHRTERAVNQKAARLGLERCGKGRFPTK
jgi:hypothetical protein